MLRKFAVKSISGEDKALERGGEVGEKRLKR
jgi:hypothetical protein